MKRANVITKCVSLLLTLNMQYNLFFLRKEKKNDITYNYMHDLPYAFNKVKKILMRFPTLLPEATWRHDLEDQSRWLNVVVRMGKLNKCYDHAL